MTNSSAGSERASADEFAFVDEAPAIAQAEADVAAALEAFGTPGMATMLRAISWRSVAVLVRVTMRLE